MLGASKGKGGGRAAPVELPCCPGRLPLEPGTSQERAWLGEAAGRQDRRASFNSPTHPSHPQLHTLPCREFLPYLESEMGALGDKSLQQEVDTLNKILAAPERG